MIEPLHDGVPRRRGRRLPHRHVPADLLDRRCHQVAQPAPPRRRASSAPPAGWSGSRRSAPSRRRLLARGRRRVRLLVAAQHRGHRRRGSRSRSWLVGRVYVGRRWSTALFLRGQRARAPERRWSQVAGDVVIATALVFLTGGRRDAPSPSSISLAVVGAAHPPRRSGGRWSPRPRARRRSSCSPRPSPRGPSGRRSRSGPCRCGAAGVPLHQQRAGPVPHRRARRLPRPAAHHHRRPALGARGVTSASSPACSSRSSPRCPRGSSPATCEGRDHLRQPGGRSNPRARADGARPANVEELIPGVRTLCTGRPRSRGHGRRRLGGRRILGLTVSALERTRRRRSWSSSRTSPISGARSRSCARADRLAALGALSAAAGARDPQPAGRDARLGAAALGPAADPETPSGWWTSSSGRRTGSASWWTDFLRLRPAAAAACGGPAPGRAGAADARAALARIRWPRGVQDRRRSRTAPGRGGPGPGPAGAPEPPAQRAGGGGGRGGRVRTFFSQVDGQVRDSTSGTRAGASPPRTCRTSSSPSSPRARGAPAWACPRSHSIVRAHGGQIEVSSSPWRRDRVRGRASPRRVHEVRKA